MRSLNYFIHNPFDIIASAAKKIKVFIPDKLYLKILFRSRMGYKLNLNKPVTYSEKLQWLKLYDRRPEYTVMVDKYAVKDFVASIIGKEYIIPTLGVWDKPSDIDWDILPNQFVLKCTHDSGGIVICTDKTKLDKTKALKKLNKSLRRNYYLTGREWPYKNVPRRIIAEKYINPVPGLKDLPDYKFFCFNGEPKYCQVISGRDKKMCIDFFDKDWNHQLFHEPKQYPFANPEPQKPKQYSKMWNLAQKLAVDKPFSRIDFYNIDDNVYFGEITLYPTSGLGGFEPKDYDRLMGNMIDLAGIKRK